MKATCACSGVLLVLLSVCASNGLTIRLLGESPNELPQLHLIADGTSALEIVVELENEQSEDSQPVALWQLGLHVSGNMASEGEVHIQSVSPSDGSLFGADPGPMTFGNLPSSDIIVSDVDPEFAGVVVPAHSSVGITRLSLVASGLADGEFTLWCGPLDFLNLDESSFWNDANDFEPTPFDNSLSPSQRIELATIQVAVQPPLLGDFNNDSRVDAADYTVWRNGLYSEFTEEDYAVWKSHFGQTRSLGFTLTVAPEPDSLVLVCVICLIVGVRKSR